MVGISLSFRYALPMRRPRNRKRCEEYLRDVFGVEWKKSACVYCPFTPLRAAALDRYREHPDAVADAMLLEHLSWALNPRATL
jgi:hypothetical protein